MCNKISGRGMPCKGSYPPSVAARKTHPIIPDEHNFGHGPLEWGELSPRSQEREVWVPLKPHKILFHDLFMAASLRKKSYCNQGTAMLLHRKHQRAQDIGRLESLRPIDGSPPNSDHPTACHVGHGDWTPSCKNKGIQILNTNYVGRLWV